MVKTKNISDTLNGRGNSKDRPSDVDVDTSLFKKRNESLKRFGYQMALMDMIYQIEVQGINSAHELYNALADVYKSKLINYERSESCNSGHNIH